MPFKIYYNEYPPSIGNSVEKENVKTLSYDYAQYWDYISNLNKKIKEDSDDASLYIERAIFRDINFYHEIAAIEIKTIRDYNTQKGRKYKLILDDFDNALHLDPSNDLFWYQKGLSVQDGCGSSNVYGDDYINASIPIFTNAIKLNSKDHKYFYSRGISYEYSKKYFEAIKDFNIAISLNPSKEKCHKAEYFGARAFCKGYGLKDWEGALNDSLEAFKIDPDCEVIPSVSECREKLNNKK